MITHLLQWLAQGHIVGVLYLTLFVWTVAAVIGALRKGATK